VKLRLLSVKRPQKNYMATSL